MSYLPVDPNIVPLLQGLKPYLGAGGNALADGVTGVVKLLSSSYGQEAVEAMSKLFTTKGKMDKTVTVNTLGGSVTFSLGLAFILFLILILLVLSGNLLAFKSGIEAGMNTGYYSQGPGSEGDSANEDGTLV